MGLEAGANRVDLSGVDCSRAKFKMAGAHCGKWEWRMLEKNLTHKCNIASLSIASNFNFNFKSSGKVKACNSQDHLCLFISI